MQFANGAQFLDFTGLLLQSTVRTKLLLFYLFTFYQQGDVLHTPSANPKSVSFPLKIKKALL